jgi:putative tryptophan/tyrosine transport system substrate-binding protein
MSEADIMIIGRSVRSVAGPEAPVKSAGRDITQAAGVFFAICVFFLLTAFCSGAAAAEKKVGILLWNEEDRYTKSKQGVLDQLKQDGFGGAAVRYHEENAKGSKAKIVAIVRKFEAEKVDLIIAIGTSAAIPVAASVKDLPIVFSMVYDPVVVGIVKSWTSSGNNVTGASPKMHMPKLMSVLQELAPVKRLAVLYTPEEKNSAVVLKELQKIQGNFHVRIIPVILNNRDRIGEIVSQVALGADAMYLTGSSVVGDAAPVIVNAANRAKVVTVTHLDDLVEKGVLLGVSVNSYHVGRMAGKKAARILTGAKPSSIPIETGKKIDIMLNMKTVRDGGFTLTPSFLEKVTNKIE